MSDHPSGSRARTRAKPVRRVEARRDSRQGARGPESPLTAAAHITLGVALSCLGGMLVMGLLAGLVLTFLYLTR